ncbi:hypothetical protein ACFYO1_22920 [Nocardia sp. NPDC006044]|uniref:hypothetical protein n=1 Tax=Nocardia sp. NPDC006044 TaxID=3364306 RepID=UPI0036917FB8
MTNQLNGASGRVRAIFDGVVSAGLRRGSVVGASDGEIDRFAAEQGVVRVPAAVREVLRIIGGQPGLWFAGTHFGVHVVDAGTKRAATATVDNVPHDIRDIPGMLVLSAHQGYAYQMIDGAVLDQDDPPVWDVSEGEEARQAWSSVSAWFAASAPNIPELYEMLQLKREIGRPVPSWAADIEDS